MPTITHPASTAAQFVVGGVDTHLDTHTAAALTCQGALLATRQFAADPAGYTALLDWLNTFGTLHKVGIEGTGSYGAGLTRYLMASELAVFEVDRPDRAARRNHGKTDPIDAENAARAVLSGRARGIPKDRTGEVEALRNLRVARSDAVSHRASCITKLKTVITTAPEPIRATLRRQGTNAMMTRCLALRPDTAAAASGDLTAAVKITLRSLARTHHHLTEQIKELDSLITPLVKTINPGLLKVHGIGPETAGQLLVTAGQNPHRIHSEAAFAMLCGAAPIPASSGKTNRHRLNRGGDRQANKALWQIALTRMGTDERTKSYVTKKTKAGHTKREIIRCIKRYLAREIYPILTA